MVKSEMQHGGEVKGKFIARDGNFNLFLKTLNN
jgi:hypothetical protein